MTSLANPRLPVRPRRPHPAAQRGAEVLAVDVTPELLALARQRAARAQVEIEWVEADAVDLPLPDGSFDRVVSTFGAMFASDHRWAASELVRVCAPGVGPARHQDASAGPSVGSGCGWRLARGSASGFARSSMRSSATATTFGPVVVARATLELEDRWKAFLDRFKELVRRFARSAGGGTQIESEYFVVTVDRRWVRRKERNARRTPTGENRDQRTKETEMALQLGETAPDFEADSTDGRISFHDWIGDSWAVLFSHPKSFTPVCTTELGYMASIKPEFDRRGVKIIGLSVDPTDDQNRWAGDIEETQGTAPNYPIISDTDFNVSKLYGMLPAAVSGDPKVRTPADNQTVRNVFVIGPDKKVKLILVYPMSTGRNFDEVLRVIDSLQLTAKHQVSTPAQWKQGDDVIISGSVNNDQAKERFGEWKEPKPYIRIVPQPN
jgi:alkyl hydroperoxide reductase subunit AhpC/SAM-dependent methyltransferase